MPDYGLRGLKRTISSRFRSLSKVNGFSYSKNWKLEFRNWYIVSFGNSFKIKNLKLKIGAAASIAVLFISGLLPQSMIGNVETATAAPTRKIPFSATLRSVGSGFNVPDGNYTITFRIYTSASGGSAVWEETQSVSVKSGILSANLGDSTAFPASLTFDGNTYYLGITVGSDEEMSPRKLIASVPSAFNADTVDGYSTTTTGAANSIAVTDSSGGLTLQGGLTVGSPILPSTNGTINLGSSTAKFGTIYANSISAGSTEISGTTSESFSINTDQATNNTEDAAIRFYLGPTLNTHAALQWSGTSNRFDLYSRLDASTLADLRLASLNVTSTGTVGGALNVTGATALSSTLGVTGATTLSSTLAVSGATTLSSTLGVAGAATLSSTLGVTGAATLSSTLAVTGNTTLTGDLAVNGGDITSTGTTLNIDVANTGTINLRDGSNNLLTVTDGGSVGNVTVTGTLGVTGATTLSSTLGVTGAATLSSTLGVTGAATLSSTLGVTGATTLSSTLGVTGAATLSSTLGVSDLSTLEQLTVNGDSTSANTDITLGDATTDQIVINAAVASDFIPLTDNTFSLGASNKRWANFYAANAVFDTLTTPNTTANSFVINSDNATADGEDSTLEFERGSTSPNAIIGWNSSTDVLYANLHFQMLANTTFGDASGDAVTSNAATWTFANDTAVALSGGVDGLNFDSNTLSIDATNNRVGIGTAAPDYFLDVAGTFGVDGAVTLGDASGDTVTSTAGAWTFSNATTVTLANSATALNFDSNTLNIDANNNRVGIGTAAPGVALDVTGAATVSSAIISGSASSGARMQFSSSTAIFENINTGVLALRGNGSNILHSNTSLNVGIGEDGGNAQLAVLSGTGQIDDRPTFQVRGDSSGTTLAATDFPQIRVVNADTTANNFAYMTFADSATGAAASTDYSAAIGVKYTDHTNNYADLLLRTRSSDGAVDRVYITAAGSVGIGDTSPDYFLDVAGTLGVDGAVTLGDASGDSVTSNAATWTFANDTSVALSGGTNGLNFDSNTLSIDATNNRIGIGTASPSAALHVVAASGSAGTGTAGDPGLTVVAGNGGSAPFDLSVPGGAGGAISLVGGDGGAWAAGTGQSGGAGGSVTITAGTGGDANSLLGNSTGAGGSVTINPGAAGSGTASSGGNGNIVLANLRGNVGIGDASPAALLTVGSGDLFQVNSSGAIAAVTGITTTGAYTQSGSSANTLTGATSFSGAVTLGDASGDSVTSNAATWTFANDTAVALSGGVDGLNFDSNTLSIDATNNRIGIGTAAPATVLDIDTSSNTAGIRLRGTSETTEIGDIYMGSSGQLVLTTQDTADASPWIELDPEDNEYGVILRDASTGATSYTNVYMHDDTTDYLHMVVNNTDAGATGLVLDDNDQVGIGDTTPDYKLDVAGTFGVDGAVTFGDASGDSVTSNAATWTFANDTAVALSGGVNGINFDSNTLSVDATNDRIGIGTAAPVNKLQVTDNSSSAVAYMLQDGAGDLLVLNATTNERFRVTNAGQLQLPTTGSSAGILLGGDAPVLYRGASGQLNLGDNAYINTFGMPTFATGTTNPAVITVGGNAATSSVAAGIAFKPRSTNAALRSFGMFVHRNFVDGLEVTVSNAAQGDVYDTGTSTTVASFHSGGQLRVPTTGSSAGILLGGDALLYRSAADTLRTPDALTVDAALTASLGITVSGSTASLNASSNNATNINTGTSTGAVTIGGGSGTVAINSSDWDIDATGIITGVGAITADGLFTGTAGATISGAAISLNASSNFGTNINTGTSSGAVAIGGGSGTVAIDSSDWDITAAGVLSGVSGITTDGGYTQSGTTANTLTGATTLSASGTALSVTNNATIGGTLTVAAITSTSSLAVTSASNGNISVTPNGTGDIVLTVSGNASQDVIIGDGGTSNYAKFDTSGALTFTGSARPYSEITLLPDDAVLPGSNNCARNQTNATNHSYFTLDCDASTDESAFWQFKMPQNYANGTNVQVDIYWVANATSGAAIFDTAYVGVADAENFDGATLTTVSGSADTTAGTAYYLNTATLTLTSPTIDANDIVSFKLLRNADHASDDLAVDAKVIKVRLRFLVGS